MIKKSIKSTIFVLLLLGTLTGLAAADDHLEPPDLDDTKSFGNDIIDCPYGTSDTFVASISPGDDIDWCKAGTKIGDRMRLFISADAYNSYVAGYTYTPSLTLVERLSKRYGDTGTGIINTSPLYIKFVNDYSNSYSNYKFYFVRTTS
ncbi:hypothetical protein [Methanosarcina siciliae]|uniref:hypothetical protein n=1 Tax=Methanosarcina siciliae TaxID=38027 RepID=UPI00064F97D6|nr:hypothetical protein [Methanosarcina siciliae]